MSATRRSFTLVATGDVLLHTGVQAQARADGGGRDYNFLPMFNAVAPLVRGADLAICHLETPLAPVGGAYSGYPRFYAPPQVAGALRNIGYDTCSTASNHSLDRGARGVTTTLAALDAVGLRHAGTARSPAEAAMTTLMDVKGMRVGQLAYSFGFHGLRAGAAYQANTIDVARILADAAAARRAGAQVAVVSLHWGTEYSHPCRRRPTCRGAHPAASRCRRRWSRPNTSTRAPRCASCRRPRQGSVRPSHGPRESCCPAPGDLRGLLLQ